MTRRAAARISSAVLVSCLLGGATCGKGLERLANLVGVADAVGGQLDDPEPATFILFDQADLPQPQQRLANGGLGDVEPLREARLGNRLARREDVVHDRLPHRLEHDVRQASRPAPERERVE